MDYQLIFYVLAGLMVAVGLAGVILPVLPGLPLTYAGMLLAAWADRFEHIGAPTLVVLGVLTLLSVVIDFASTALGAKRVGAGRKAVIGSLVGTVVGLFFLPLGLFAGPFLGALAGELLDGRALVQAGKVGVATWVGLFVGTVLKLGLGFAMLALFLVAWWH